MDKVTARELNEKGIFSLRHKLPIAVTYDGETIAVICGIGQWNQLTREYRQAESQAKEVVRQALIEERQKAENI